MIDPKQTLKYVVLFLDGIENLDKFIYRATSMCHKNVKCHERLIGLLLTYIVQNMLNFCQQNGMGYYKRF